MVKKKKWKAFTLLEMMVVLFVISILLLLFVPGIMNQKKSAEKKSDDSIVKVVETQMDVFELDHDKQPSLDELESKGYITEKQRETYEKIKNKPKE
ncbi:prepilin-type N-terminal cleavage/methylation domain-containing protein [Enterococcus sp. 669A]|uniref:Prepilin-type N-terminal cleavage/methylation domain-containing protein n=1 Tax=Candidatus Enterococcus moelleringii TaxID=2815325 RepID=A0ABS3LIJ5_9ENTE|nr:competence type IV pilus major pilin ComGC [Enterococcus sp. 669A]MBO1308194.1 prepilin-type N-terminal cleavage/methylation domain-containing protein [Enterococcus sp. 669A]